MILNILEEEVNQEVISDDGSRLVQRLATTGSTLASHMVVTPALKPTHMDDVPVHRSGGKIIVIDIK